MSRLDELKQQLKEAEAAETSAYGQYMYYECADRGYDAEGASEAKKKYRAAEMKADMIRQEIMELEEHKDDKDIT